MMRYRWIGKDWSSDSVVTNDLFSLPLPPLYIVIEVSKIFYIFNISTSTLLGGRGGSTFFSQPTAKRALVIMVTLVTGGVEKTLKHQTPQRTSTGTSCLIKHLFFCNNCGTVFYFPYKVPNQCNHCSGRLGRLTPTQ